MFKHVKQILSRNEKVGTPGQDISVYFQGKEIFREKRGVADEKGTPVSGTERYNIYSCSKIITCVAALKLIEQGKLRLEDELAQYLSAFSDMTVQKNGGIFKAENKIKIINLFMMTAGLNYATASKEILQGKAETNGKCPTVEMMNYIAKMPLDFEPGERWQYSLAHDVLAAVVEKASGKRFGQFVEEEIFSPLGMTRSTFLLPKEELPTLCAQYRYDGNGKYTNVGREIQWYKFGSEYESGGAGCISTVDEYICFLEGIRTGKILSMDTLNQMTADLLTARQRPTCGVPNGYGFGLGVRVPNGSGKRTDFGWGGAAGAFWAVDRKNEISVFYAPHVLGAPITAWKKDIIEAVKLDLGLSAFEEDMFSDDGNLLY